jgi:hypothetical protein
VGDVGPGAVEGQLDRGEPVDVACAVAQLGAAAGDEDVAADVVGLHRGRGGGAERGGGGDRIGCGLADAVEPERGVDTLGGGSHRRSIGEVDEADLGGGAEAGIELVGIAYEQHGPGAGLDEQLRHAGADMAGGSGHGDRVVVRHERDGRSEP